MSETEVEPQRLYRCDGARIRAERDRRCWAQADLAQEAGIGRRTISRMETGAAVSSRVIHDVAAALQLDFEDLLTSPRLGRHNLPPLSPLHVPREELLREVGEALAPERSTREDHCRMALLTGPPGIGKSEMALSYGWRHLSDYATVLWVPAGETLDHRLAALAPLVDAEERTDLAQQAIAVRDALSRGGPHLLILDDVVDAHVWRHWILDRTEVRLLVTSRIQIRGPERILVGGLDPEEAADFVGGGTVTPTISRICASLGYNTLALAVARELLEDGEPPEALADAIAEDHIAWSTTLDESRLPFVKSPNLDALFASSIGDLEARGGAGALAASMLLVAGWCEPGSIPVEILTDGATHLLGSTPTPMNTRRAVGLLISRSLATQLDPGRVRVHGLTAAWARRRGGAPAQEAFLHGVVELAHRFGTTIYDVRALLEHHGQLQRAADLLTAAASPQQLLVLHHLCECNWHCGLYAEAERMATRGIALASQPDSQVHFHCHRGQILTYQGRYDEAVTALRHGIEIVGVAPRLVAQTHHALGVALYRQAQERGGCLEASLASMEHAHALLETTHGSDHPLTVAARAGLAQLLAATGRLEEARGVLRHCHEEARRLHGPGHSEVFITGFLLADVCARLHHEGAVERMAMFLGELETQSGPDHPQIRSMRRRLARHRT